MHPMLALCLSMIPLGFPAASWFALAAIPVVAAYFYRRRSRAIEVPSVFLWEQIGRPVDVRSIAALLRRLLSLVVQLLVLALLIFALADPWPKPRRTARRVIVLDVSATMQTREGNTDRFAQARQRALRSLDQLQGATESAVLLAGVAPVLAQPLTSDVNAARQAVESATPQDVEGDLRAAIRTAAALMDPGAPGEVVVCSDFVAADPATEARAWAGPGKLLFEPVGSDQPDAAITQIWSDAQPMPAAGGSPGSASSSMLNARVTAVVAQRGMAGRQVPVRLEIDGQPVETRDVVLAAEPATVEFATTCSPGAVAKVTVDSHDALSVDDVANLVITVPGRRRINLVTAGPGGALEKALRADLSIDLRIIPPSQAGRADDATILVFNDVTPRETALDPGRAEAYLFVHCADPFGWSTAAGDRPAGPVTQWSADPPITAGLDPTQIVAPRALTLDWQGATAPPHVVLWADTVPLITSVTPAGGRPRCVYWQFDAADARLDARSVFPLLLWNTLDYLGGADARAASASHATGQPLHLTDVAGAALTAPDGRIVQIVAGAGEPPSGIVYDTARQGVYRMARSGRSEPIAVNLLSARGTLAPRAASAAPPPEPTPIAAPSVAGSGFFARLAWDRVLMIVVAFLLLEWLAYHRRAIGVG